jgi:DNA polymerase III epsilon subunit-like protein
MLKMETLVKEGTVQIPSTKLLRWFLQRKNNTFIMFDTETTGLGGRGRVDQITQLAAIAVKFDLRALKFVEIERFQEKIKLNDHIKDVFNNTEDVPADATDKEVEALMKYQNNVKATLKFNHYDLLNSEHFADERDALERFDDFIENHPNVVLMAHNAPFDLKMIQVHEIFQTKTREIFDTVDFFKTVFFPALESLSQENEHYKSINDRFVTNSKGKSAAMGNLIPGFHPDPEEQAVLLSRSHDAVVDCENTLSLIEKGLALVVNHIR